MMEKVQTLLIAWILGCRSINSELQCWSSLGPNEYFVMTNHGGADYNTAMNTCKSKDAHLVSIHSKPEHEFIDKLRNDLVGVPVWIGLRSFGIGLIYTWSDETSVDYLPSIERFEKPLEVACVFLYYDWYEGDCGNSLHFICKRQAQNSSESCDKETSVQTSSPHVTTHLTTEAETITEKSTPNLSTYSTKAQEEKSSITTENREATTISTSTTDIATDLISPSTNTQLNDQTTVEYPAKSTNNLQYPKTTRSAEIFTTSPSLKTNTRNPTSFVTQATTDVITASTQQSTTEKRKPQLLPEEIDQKVKEIVKKLKIYKLPKRPTREAPGGEAIGAVALFILIGIIGGIVLLDLVTIQNHIKLFLRNVRRRPYKKRKRTKRDEQGQNNHEHQLSDHL